jgi:hypothetical protein
LALGKIAPEKVADMFAKNKYKLNSQDKPFSPRTKEMWDISTIIRKSFSLKS